MINLAQYRNGQYSGYNSSEAVLAAIDELATDALPTGDSDGEEDDARRAASDAVRLWGSPTANEQAAIEARAWQMARADEDTLFWGQHTMHRPVATTYTVMRAWDSDNAESGLSVSAAAEALLSADGYEHEFRPNENRPGLELWISKASRNSTGPRGFNRSVFFSLDPDEAAAKAEIFRRVVDSGHEWHGLMVVSDEQFAEIKAAGDAADAELAAERGAA